MTNTVRTSRLYFYGRNGRLLSDGLYLNTRPCTITGIMGPAGSGKSVFLKLLNGYIRPSRGYVLVGEVDVHKRYRQVQGSIGYVPQAEIMIPELKVKESLDYRLQLHAPLRSGRKRRETIRDLCARLKFADLDDLLNKRIGSPDAKGSYPSGGERRRINIAHELLSKPQLLFLDEPTSGLSSIDAERLIQLLKQLADEGLTVVMTIHQPSRSIYELLDDLLLICWDGKPAYYGRAGDAVEYFQGIGGVKLRPEQNPAEYLLYFIRDKKIGAWSVTQFERGLSRRVPDYLGFPLPSRQEAGSMSESVHGQSHPAKDDPQDAAATME
jgi:ABC-type multidrug transport system ATPase subunit